METDIPLVATKCTPLCIKERPPFQFKVHRSDGISLPSNTQKQKLTNHPSKNPMDDRARSELEMKRARYEVMKFSSSRLEGREREEADVALAVSLGAVPPKREYMNYKELIQKKNMDKDVVDVKHHSIPKLKAKLKKSKGKNKKDGTQKKGKMKGKGKNKVAILQSYGKLAKGKKSRLLEK